MKREVFEVLVERLNAGTHSRSDLIVLNMALEEIKGIVQDESPSQGPESNIQQHPSDDAGHDEQPLD